MSQFSMSMFGVECAGCVQHEYCESPRMRVAGEGKEKVMFVTDFVTQEEDVAGSYLVGELGAKLQDYFYEISGKDIFEACWVTSAVNCSPAKVDDVDNYLVNLCKHRLIAAINKLKPKVIVAIGAWATLAVFGTKNVDLLYGYQVPDGRTGAWLCSVIGTQRVMTERNFDYYLEKMWMSGIYKAYKMRDKSFDKPEFKWKAVRNMDYILAEFEKAHDRKLFVFDYENFPLKPYNKNSLLVSCAFCSDENVITFPVDGGITEHNFWTTKDAKKLKGAFQKVFTSKEVVKVAYNIKHERSWSIAKFGVDLERPWHDVMLMHSVLRGRRGGNGLDFLAWMYFGDKDYSTQINRYYTQMHRCPVSLRNPYNAKDTAYTYFLYNYYKKFIEKYPKQKKLYMNNLQDYTDSTLKAEVDGILISKKEKANLAKRYVKSCKKAENAIFAMDTVQAYENRIGRKLKITSPQDVGKYMEFAGHTLLKSSKGNKKVDKKWLKEQNTEFTQNLTLFREYEKLLSTYLYGLEVYDDGRVHGSYNIIGTDTGRWSSNSPNLQNFPKRNHPELRKMFIAPKGYIILHLDYEQWEVKVLAMYSKDKTLIADIKNGVDFHAHYAELIFKYIGITPKSPDFKKFRQEAKNQVVFPTFYNASYRSIGTALHRDFFRFHDFSVGDVQQIIKEAQEALFARFPGVKEFGERLQHFYSRKGYIETFFGRRRYAPLSYTKLVNTPIQSTAGEFTNISHARVSKLGYSVPLAIHDEINVIVPEDGWYEHYLAIHKQMKTWDYDFINVPVDVGVDVGYNWFQMYPVDEVMKAA